MTLIRGIINLFQLVLQNYPLMAWSNKILKVILFKDLVWRLLIACFTRLSQSNNGFVVKSGNDDFVGHVQEALAKKWFSFMKSQR